MENIHHFSFVSTLHLRTFPHENFPAFDQGFGAGESTKRVGGAPQKWLGIERTFPRAWDVLRFRFILQKIVLGLVMCGALCFRVESKLVPLLL